jgi:hypothetical protein
VRVLRLAAVPLLLLTGGLAATGTASATTPHHRQAVVHHDARHDVAVVTSKPSLHYEPRRRDIDITSVRVRYGAHALRIHVNFVRLDKPKAHQDLIGLIALTSQHGAYAELGTTATARHPHGTDDFFVGTTLSCNLTHTINYREARMTFVVPVACFGRPPWVRVALASELANDAGALSAGHQVFDEAFQGRTRHAGDTDFPASPRLYRP